MPGPLQRSSPVDGVDRQLGSNAALSGNATESPPKDRAFLDAFDRALRRRDSLACLRLVRNIASPGQPTGASQAFLGALLRGRHQALMRQLIADGNVEGALEYLGMLPPSGHLEGALLKACMDTGDLGGLQRIVQARGHFPCEVLPRACCRGCSSGSAACRGQSAGERGGGSSARCVFLLRAHSHSRQGRRRARGVARL